MKFRSILYSLLTEDQEGVYKKYFSDIERENFIRIISADPKTVIEKNKIIRLGSYYKFLIDMYRNGNLKFEDLPKAEEYLELIYKYRIKIGQMKIQTISDLYEIVKDKIVKTNASPSQIIASLDKKDYSVKLNEGSWFIIVPLTEKAAAYLGVNTEWCTTWGKYCLNPNYKDRTNHFKSYHSPESPLYIIINKENELDKYQLNFSSNQLKNPADQEVSNRAKFFDEKLEVKRYFFPSLYDAEPPLDNVKYELNRGKKFLDQSDLAIYKRVIYAKYKDVNPFVNILIEENEEGLENFITDPTVSCSFNRGNLEFELKDLPDNVSQFHSNVNYLKAISNEAYNDTWQSESDNYYYNSEDILQGYLTTYYEKNRGKLIDLFGLACKTYDSFFEFAKNSGILKDDKVKEKYLEEYSNSAGAALAQTCDNQAKEYESLLFVDHGYSYRAITIGIENVIEVVAENDINEINSLEDFMEKYMYHYDLPSDDYMEYPEYNHDYPSDEYMESVFDDYFDAKHENFYDSEDTGCKEVKNQFVKIFEKYFNEKGIFENEFIKIELKQPWFQNFSCEKGVDISLHNKKTNETYDGYVKIDNLVNHMQIEPLFERLSLTKLLKNIN